MGLHGNIAEAANWECAGSNAAPVYDPLLSHYELKVISSACLSPGAYACL